uniref:NADH:ubiquinone reductase (H(+)-translocating) n=1 Tax=Botrylloides nigrum TaxID=1256663 RepID=S0DGV1_9ASCI|nr:NADH dehydrogenase subunit 5 [Botrylloides nigrum]CCO25788.1 NADH dehydrogenase subunit 5 [Botrylloides nigrum]
MVHSLYFSMFLVGFIFLFFFLLILQVLAWKNKWTGVLGGVFGVYKLVLVGMLIFVELFFVNLGGFGVNLFFEMNLWFNLGPYFCLDLFSCIFFVSAGIVSWSIMQFGIDYMTDESGVGNFLFYLLIFLLLMFVLVFSGNFLMLFVGWEGVGLLSFLLISWWGGRYEASSGCFQAVYYNRVGDAGLLMFLVLSLVLGNGLMIVNNFMLSSFFFLFVLGVVSKSSQLVFHPWLPNAMEGPTPVSSLLHSSTMVMAGVFLMMRSLDFFEFKNMIYLLGMLTCILGGFLGMNHMDFKKVVAYSTTSQLGFMMMVLGAGWSWLCLLYMMIHAFFKAMIFMMSGVVIHMSGGIQDFRHMFTSLVVNNVMFFFYFLGGVVMMGFPFLSGFWMKDIILEGLMGSYFGFFCWSCFIISVLLTGLYSMRLYLGVFIGDLGTQHKVMLLSPLLCFLPFMRLMLGSVVFGLFIFQFCGPFSHYLLTGEDKYFALGVFILGVLISVILKGILKGLSYLVGGYLLFFNPVWHKMFSFVGYWYSRVVGLLDFLFMEYLFYGGVKSIWNVVVSYRFFVVFIVVVLLVLL